MTSWKTKATAAGGKSNRIQEVWAKSCYYEPSERGNKKVISVVLTLSTYSKLNSADGNVTVPSVLPLWEPGAAAETKAPSAPSLYNYAGGSLSCSQLSDAHLLDRVLPLVHKHACMQCVLCFALPKMQFSGCRKHSNTMAFLGCTVWTSCDLGRNKDRKSPQGSRCTSDILKCWGICHGQTG